MSNTLPQPVPAVRIASTASVYDGFFFRDNLQSQGDVPASAPFNQCPDIIGAPSPIPKAESVLSTEKSLQTMYDCEPVVGATNYYYLRGMNGADGAVSDGLSLYWAPAQLILFPSTWQGNPLATDAGAQSVPVSADPGHFGVAGTPFVWKDTPAPAGSTFYSFVAQAASTKKRSPVAPVDWMGMSQLLTTELSLGFRNLAYVDPAAAAWLHQVGITIPDTVGESQTLTLTVTSSGFDGCTLAIVADRFTAQQELPELRPVQLDGGVTGFTFTADPGFAAQLTVQCWNPGKPVAAGSSITVSVSCPLADDRIEEALERGALSFGFGPRGAGLAVGPTQSLLLGAVSFVADAS